jgi:RNA polymerase sigma-70 factor (ECF subfamily)
MITDSVTKIDVKEYYTRYGPMVMRRCRQILRNEEMARDAMHDVFVKLLLNQERLKAQYPSSLLYRISTNVCLNVLRAGRLRQTSGQEDILDRIAVYDEGEERMVFGNLLDQLFKSEKASTREIAVMLFVDGMTLKEVAHETSLSVSAIRQRIRKFRSRIQLEGDSDHE